MLEGLRQVIAVLKMFATCLPSFCNVESHPYDDVI
jgi:hypothetical protein